MLIYQMVNNISRHRPLWELCILLKVSQGQLGSEKRPDSSVILQWSSYCGWASEILHHQKDGWNPMNNTYQLQDFATTVFSSYFPDPIFIYFPLKIGRISIFSSQNSAHISFTISWLVVEPYPSEKWWSESQLGWFSIPNCFWKVRIQSCSKPPASPSRFPSRFPPSEAQHQLDEDIAMPSAATAVPRSGAVRGGASTLALICP